MGYTGMHTPDKYPGLHDCTGCGLELDADDSNDTCDECTATVLAVAASVDWNDDEAVGVSR